MATLLDPSDIELMLRVRDQQDAAAFEELMRRYRQPAVSFLLRLTGNAGIAQDLAEETFVRIWLSAGRYEAKAKFTTWLFTIASRLATDQLRREKVRRSVPLEAPTATEAHSPAETLADTLPAADQILLQEQTAAAVQTAIQELPVEQRTALVLCEFENLSYAEAASSMGCTVKSVELRIYRAKQTLREKLRSLLQ